MDALVRVKRKRSDSIVDSLLVSYKKHCPIGNSVGEANGSNSSTILKFIGTVDGEVSIKINF